MNDVGVLNEHSLGNNCCLFNIVFALVSKLTPDRDTNMKYDKELEKLLEELRPINLTRDIYYENPDLEVHGGNSDVFKGKSRKHGDVEVAVKRLRVHILKQKDISKKIIK